MNLEIFSKCGRDSTHNVEGKSKWRCLLYQKQDSTKISKFYGYLDQSTDVPLFYLLEMSFNFKQRQYTVIKNYGMNQNFADINPEWDY